MFDKNRYKLLNKRLKLFIIYKIWIIAAVPAYVGARFLLLVITFTSLRGLSKDALQDVEWTSFIPHVG